MWILLGDDDYVGYDSCFKSVMVVDVLVMVIKVGMVLIVIMMAEIVVVALVVMVIDNDGGG